MMTGFRFPNIVMPGLGPGIHAFSQYPQRKAWMPGPSPGMTVEDVGVKHWTLSAIGWPSPTPSTPSGFPFIVDNDADKDRF